MLQNPSGHQPRISCKRVDAGINGAHCEKPCLLAESPRSCNRGSAGITVVTQCAGP